jgi:hypothetical protein
MFTVTKMFLERSAPLPIPVFIHPFIHVRDTPDLLPILVSAAHRWRDFNLEYDMENFDMGLLARALAGNLETLEKLRLALHNLDFEVDVFLSAPRLRDVTIEVEGVSSNLLPMPWAQLTRLSLSYDSPQLCLDILAGCKNLVSANILTDQWLATDSPDVSATGILDHLEKLTIFMRICSTGEHLGPFLRRLRLPALKSLSLTLALLLPVNSEWFISWVAPTMISFLIRSPNIECLSVANCVSAEDMQDVLQYTPFLTRLTFSDRAVDDTFFAALRYSATGPIQLAPKLEVLELFDVGVDFTETTFAEMIRSRWSASSGVARLKRVNLQNYLLGPKHFTQEFAEMMEGCRSQGLELDVY